MVKFEGKFNEDIQKRAMKQAFKKIILMSSLIGLLFIGLGIFFIEDNLYLGMLYIFLGLALVPLTILIRRMKSKRAYQTTSIISDKSIMRFAFDENQMYIQHCKYDEYRSATEAKYSYLYKVVKTKKEYLVYVSMYSLHIIPFDYLIEGTLEELDSYFKNNIDNRFNAK